MFQCKVPLDPGSSGQFYPTESPFKVAARLSRLPACSPQAFKALYSAEISFYVAEVSSRSLWSSPCGRILHRNRIPRILNRISTCNSNTSTKVSGLGILYLFLYLQCFCIKTRSCKNNFTLLLELILPSIQICVSNHPSKHSLNSNKVH